eukprot:194924_1
MDNYVHWTKERVIDWLVEIDNGDYCDNKYIQYFMENNINGQSLHSMKNVVNLIKTLQYKIDAKICKKMFTNIQKLQQQQSNSTTKLFDNNMPQSINISSSPSTSTQCNAIPFNVNTLSLNANNNSNNNNNSSTQSQSKQIKLTNMNNDINNDMNNDIL